VIGSDHDSRVVVNALAFEEVQVVRDLEKRAPGRNGVLEREEADVAAACGAGGEA
jgi:hypothetical protein